MRCDYRCEKTDMAGQDCKTCPAKPATITHLDDQGNICCILPRAEKKLRSRKTWKSF